VVIYRWWLRFCTRVFAASLPGKGMRRLRRPLVGPRLPTPAKRPLCSISPLLQPGLGAETKRLGGIP